MRIGWIKLYRKLLDSNLYKNLNSKQRDVMMVCLMLANHEENEWEWQNEVYVCKPGQFITSLESIASNCACDVKVQSVRTALLKLEKWHFLTNKSTKTGRLISIVKWEQYQSEDIETNKQTNKQLTKSQQSSNKQLTTIKNDKNVKNNTVNSIGASTTNVEKEDKRNEQVNLILSEFSNLYGHNPIDKQPRRQAWNIIQKITSFAKKRGKDTSNGFMDKAIKHVFVWAGSQHSLENVKNLDAIRRNLELYFAEIERAYEKRTNTN